jgi:hypothetical protein
MKKIRPKHQEAHYESSFTDNRLRRNLADVLERVRLGGGIDAANIESLGQGGIQGHVKGETFDTKPVADRRNVCLFPASNPPSFERLAAAGIAEESRTPGVLCGSERQPRRGSTSRQYPWVRHEAPAILSRLRQCKGNLLATCWHTNVSFKPSFSPSDFPLGIAS